MFWEFLSVLWAYHNEFMVAWYQYAPIILEIFLIKRKKSTFTSIYFSSLWEFVWFATACAYKRDYRLLIPKNFEVLSQSFRVVCQGNANNWIYCELHKLITHETTILKVLNSLMTIYTFLISDSFFNQLILKQIWKIIFAIIVSSFISYQGINVFSDGAFQK